MPKQAASSQPETLPNTEARGDGEPTRIVLYEDFNCVHCADFESTNGDQIEQWLEQGEVTVEYRMVDYLSAPNNQNYSARAANAAYCVADQ
ncbi:DsbA family protein, partial [Rothia kristinae]|uniref:DsbA family protein n=1 Tax=Rothia kristinae TaxID=37923 RepID=UPI0021B69E33